ncbi:hypothetical protein [Aeromicrobium chenweiae]|uniref:Uncharacterized protein n=1 Tax=Aeromicrobium chenweiae TaxID=2079793 RepID=A0A2S0WHR4_9ACTN|nr:hypothetical protein [Aeromicrobium chenweiae]AWB90868.1 hypothetical protein C3E78_00710 [Aeromicrobium chenweiae]TGN32088.1 hypothetical protein E4L97_10230 [Aeromicrobium chenweiae]
MGQRAWTTNEADLLTIRFLDWVASHNDGNLIHDALAFYEDSGTPTEAEKGSLIAVVKDLDARGLITGEQSMGGWATYGAVLTPAGRQLVRDRTERRASRRARSVTARDALLDWMYENTNDEINEAPEIDTFSGTVHAHVEADPFTEPEITAAATFLRDEDFVTGIRVGFGPPVIRPRVTAKGQRAVTSGAYTTEPAASASSTHNTVNVHGGNYGQAGAGQIVTQEQTVGADLEHLPDLLAAVHDALSGLPENEISGAEAYLTMIEAMAASDEPNRGVLEVAGRGLANLGDKATNAITGASIRTLWLYLASRFGFPAG